MLRRSAHGPTVQASEATMSDTGAPENQGDEGEVAGVTAVSESVEDLDGDGVPDLVERTTITESDIDGDGQPDIVEVRVTALDVDGDGVPDVLAMTTATSVDVDGDGVADAVVVVEAVGVDADGDGTLSEDEIEVTGTVLVRDDDQG
jgi:hypothetical protein